MTLIVENEAKLPLFVVGDVINDKNRYRDAPNDLVPQIIGLRAIESPMNFVCAAVCAVSVGRFVQHYAKPTHLAVPME